MFDFTNGKPLPDHGLFGVSEKFSRIALQQTALCHNRCCFCPLHQDKETPKGVMDTASLEVVLRSLPDFSGVVDLATDGESFMLADLPKRCALIMQHWPRCSISLTSTFNIDRGPEFIKALFAAGLQGLRISCYGHTVGDYQKIHGSDSFDALRRNIGYLKEVPDIEK
jgi:molybdenum cofactor biosynthesis enzyme MoaA